MAEPLQGPFLVEGAWAVESVLGHRGYRVSLLTVESGRHRELVHKALELGVPVVELNREQIREERGFDFHRGVYAEVERPVLEELSPAVAESLSCIVIPFGLADPGNLGTVIRSAVGFGADAIAVPEGFGADIYNRKCIRASATALFRTSLFKFSHRDGFLSLLESQNFVRFATCLDEASCPLEEVEPADRMAVFFGSESDGLPEDVLSSCDKRVIIPMQSDIDSLNVGSSAAVVLYDLLRRKRSEVAPLFGAKREMKN